ncbi:MAG: polysaccharide biosynthesis protein PslH [Gaiellaceae bacterium]|jgi:glycosyltransferase involved in cell wall biosynthesis|nr:polysaccharide biosynthesis protein PslH [Gaiellaceae bacterium]
MSQSASAASEFVPAPSSVVKLLVVLPQPPVYEGGAPGRCSVALLRGLREHGIDVTALSARRPLAPHERNLDNGAGPPADLPVELMEVPAPRQGWATRAQMLMRPNGYLSRGPFGARVRELATQADLLHLEQLHSGWCDLGSSVPAVVHVHHLMRLDRRAPAPWDRELFGFTMLRASERLIALRHRYLVASSSVVAQTLRRLALGREVHVAPLSLEPSRYPQAPLDGPPVAGLIGTATWPPTRAAIERLVSTVWPLVRREVPEATLRIAGRGTDRLRLDDLDGVEIVGEVPSAAAFLHGLSLLLYPAPIGSGMKVKVLESIACGLPVVTTEFGAEGIAAGDGVVVERDDAELAAAAVSLLRDDVERRQRSRAGRKAFLEKYTPKVATEPLVDLYRRMLEAG